MGDNLMVNIAVIGLGNMGSSHLQTIDKTGNTNLVAVCDIDKEKANNFANKYGVNAFYNYKELLNWGQFHGVIISTPHYDHTVITLEAFKKGFNVLTEKPVGVHSNDIEKMIKAWEVAKEINPKIIFAAMFQQRTLEQYKKIKDLIDSGELGRLVRATWIITDWFRTQNYYDNGGWRATWKGEGGGVLINQCPHQLDLYQWFFGMPHKVSGFASIGKYHNIEVEDEVTGFFQHDNGMIGHFITSTGESPGTNRLEIVGEMGKLVFENDNLTFFRNRKSMFKQLQDGETPFEKCENWEINIPYKSNEASAHGVVIKNFAEAILNNKDLIAPAEEGIHSVSLGNAIMLSQFEGQTVNIPIDGDLYFKKLINLIDSSNYKKKPLKTENRDVDMSASF